MHKREAGLVPWSRAALGVLLAAAGFVATASAATLLAVDLGQLVRMSDYVVVARAESRSARKHETSGMIVTDVRLRVLTGLKGESKPGDSLVATLLGGAIGDVGLQVPGEAAIPDDRSAIVFLRRTQTGELNVSGMSQGVMLITGQGKTAQVAPATTDAALMQRDASGTLREAPEAAPKPRSLADVLTEIRGLAASK